MKRHRVLIVGSLSPIAATALLMAIGFYAERVGGRLFTLSPLTFGITTASLSSVPFFITLFLAVRERRTCHLGWLGRLGLFFALVSLIVPMFLLRGTVLVLIGMQHQAAHNIPAPLFQARDLNGKMQCLGDHRGEVVLVNVWATWCVHCLSEMPKLDRLFREHQNQGLMVFGLSNEDATIQRKGLTGVQVTYPLLTYHGRIPALYRYVALYPTTFVIDRRGILQPAISDHRSDKLESTVIDLLNRRP